LTLHVESNSPTLTSSCQLITKFNFVFKIQFKVKESATSLKWHFVSSLIKSFKHNRSKLRKFLIIVLVS